MGEEKEDGRKKTMLKREKEEKETEEVDEEDVRRAEEKEEIYLSLNQNEGRKMNKKIMEKNN